MFQVPVAVTLVGAPSVVKHPNPGGLAKVGLNPIARGIASQLPMKNQNSPGTLVSVLTVYATVMF